MDTTGLSREHKDYIEKSYEGATRKTVRELREGQLTLEEINEHSPLKDISGALYGDREAPLILPKRYVRSVGRPGSRQQSELLDEVIADVQKSFRVLLTREQVRRYHKLYKKVLREVAELEACLAEPPSEPER